MFRTKLVMGVDPPDLNEGLNKALSEITSESIDIKFADSKTAFIIYEIEELYKKEICCDCAYWDDSHNTNNMVGLCQHCGQRKRFSDKACPNYLDIRA